MSREHLLSEESDCTEPQFPFQILTTDQSSVYDQRMLDKKALEILPNGLLDVSDVLPNGVVKSPKIGGKSLGSAEFAVVQYQQPDQSFAYAFLATPGKYRVDYLARWHPSKPVKLLGPFSLAQSDCIHFGDNDQRLVQVPAEKIGFLRFNSQTVPIAAGTYWIKSSNIQYLGSAHINQSIISHDDMTLLRVNEGAFACYQLINGQTKVLAPNPRARYLLRRGEKLLGIHSLKEQYLMLGEQHQDGYYFEVLSADQIRFRLFVGIRFQIAAPDKIVDLSEPLESVLNRIAQDILYLLMSRKHSIEDSPGLFPEAMIEIFREEFSPAVEAYGIQFLKLCVNNVVYADKTIDDGMSQVLLSKKMFEAKAAAAFNPVLANELLMRVYMEGMASIINHSKLTEGQSVISVAQVTELFDALLETQKKMQEQLPSSAQSSFFGNACGSFTSIPESAPVSASHLGSQPQWQQ